MNPAFKLEMPAGFPDLSREDFHFFRQAIFALAGISLSDNKIGLAKTRLQSRLMKLKLPDYPSYRALLEGLPKSDPEWQEFTNSLTTNKTDFFREPQHFSYLCNEIVPSWRSRREAELRIWSAACSSGEEPYSLALALSATLARPERFRILASDIDTNILATAANGVYPRARLTDIPAHLHGNYLQPGSGEIEGWFRMSDALREPISFLQHNLTSPGPPAGGPFHVIFCRNVFIYFTPATIEQILGKFHSALSENGFLFIGMSESIQKHQGLFSQVAPSIYQKKS